MATPTRKKSIAKTKAPPALGKGSTPVASSAAAKQSSVKTAQRQRVRLETRTEMLERLTNPQISLHEAGVILRVCGATVRHYCNAGYLPHLRTPGGQRRFYLREVLAFLNGLRETFRL